ncbi:MAG: hypothetical protein ACOCZ7_04800, partial [Armatimonadota bacterium]
NPDIPLPPHDRLMPVGWYETHIAVAEEEGDETETLTEYVMVYDSTQPKPSPRSRRSCRIGLPHP